MFWEIVCGSIAYLITGVIMWFPDAFGRILVSISYVIHDISALVMLFGIFFHVYLSTFGEPGTIQAMTRGTVERSLGVDASSGVVQGRNGPRSATGAARGREATGGEQLPTSTATGLVATSCTAHLGCPECRQRIDGRLTP